MKVFLYYEDNDDSTFHKTLKITLPKKWKTGPTSRVLQQFVESYNDSASINNTLDVDDVHFALRKKEDFLSHSNNLDMHSLISLASDDVVIDTIEDRADVYVMHGKAQTREEIKTAKEEEAARIKKEREGTARCTRYGCDKRFPKGGPYPECHYHTAPPTFHETAKYWSCCPKKKAYDWDEFQQIKGCQTGVCSEFKEEAEQKEFLGGCDVRDLANGGGAAKLKSIDDFNKADQDGSEAAPVLDRLRAVLGELDVDNELFDQVVDGMKTDIASRTNMDVDGSAILGEVKDEIGQKLKSTLKAIAVDQLRIK